MNSNKKQGQRLIPEYLLKYATELEENHPDPSESWGGGGGGEYTAGYGIEISDHDIISIDDEVVALKSQLNGYIKNNDSSYSATFRGKAVWVKAEGAYTSTSYSDGAIGRTIPNQPGYTYTLPNKTGTFAMTSDIITSYNDLTDKPTIPTKTSDLDNDSGFITGVAWDDVTDKPTFATVATSGDYDDLLNKPTIPTVDYPVTDVQVDGVSVVSNKVASITMPTVPTKVSDLDNDSGFITSSALSGYATETWVGQQGYLTSVSWSDVSGKPTFATVATTGDYDDLLNKPTIPTVNCNIIQITRTYSEGSWTENWPDQATTALIKANPERYAFIVKTVNEDTIEIFFSPLLTATLEDPGSSIYYRWGANVADSSNITTCTVTVNISNQWWYSEATSSYSPYSAGTGISISSGSISVDTTTVALKTDIPTVPTNVSAFTNDSGYITSSALSGYATETWVGNQGYLTSVSWTDVSNKPSFATVATSGSYTDLTDKPTIPTIPVTDVQVNGTSVLSGTVASVSVPTSASSTSTSTSSVTPTTETLVFTLSDNSTVTVNVMTGATVSTTTTTTTTLSQEVSYEYKHVKR